MSKAIQELFTSIAPTYDFLNHLLSFSIDKRWRDHAIESLESEDLETVLDLCAGTLDLTQKLVEQFPRAKVYAVDFALAMLEAGKTKIDGFNQVSRICADGHHLPLADESLDAVVCAFGIRNLEDRAQAAGEIRRVLKPQGKLVVLEFFRPDTVFARAFYRTYGKHILPRIGGAISKNRGAYEYLQNSILDFMSVEEYGDLLIEHDFKDPSFTPLSGGIAYQVVAEG